MADPEPVAIQAIEGLIDRIGSLVLWRMAIKPGRPVAMGIIGGTPFIGLPGNPVASFVTFVANNVPIFGTMRTRQSDPHFVMLCGILLAWIVRRRRHHSNGLNLDWGPA